MALKNSERLFDEMKRNDKQFKDLRRPLAKKPLLDLPNRHCQVNVSMASSDSCASSHVPENDDSMYLFKTPPTSEKTTPYYSLGLSYGTSPKKKKRTKKVKTATTANNPKKPVINKEKKKTVIQEKKKTKMVVQEKKTTMTDQEKKKTVSDQEKKQTVNRKRKGVPIHVSRSSDSESPIKFSEPAICDWSAIDKMETPITMLIKKPLQDSNAIRQELFQKGKSVFKASSKPEVQKDKQTKLPFALQSSKPSILDTETTGKDLVKKQKEDSSKPLLSRRKANFVLLPSPVLRQALLDTPDTSCLSNNSAILVSEENKKRLLTEACFMDSYDSPVICSTTTTPSQYKTSTPMEQGTKTQFQKHLSEYGYKCSTVRKSKPEASLGGYKTAAKMMKSVQEQYSKMSSYQSPYPLFDSFSKNRIHSRKYVRNINFKPRFVSRRVSSRSCEKSCDFCLTPGASGKTSYKNKSGSCVATGEKRAKVMLLDEGNTETNKRVTKRAAMNMLPVPDCNVRLERLSEAAIRNATRGSTSSAEEVSARTMPYVSKRHSKSKEIKKVSLSKEQELYKDKAKEELQAVPKALNKMIASKKRGRPKPKNNESLNSKAIATVSNKTDSSTYTSLDNSRDAIGENKNCSELPKSSPDETRDLFLSSSSSEMASPPRNISSSSEHANANRVSACIDQSAALFASRNEFENSSGDASFYSASEVLQAEQMSKNVTNATKNSSPKLVQSCLPFGPIQNNLVIGPSTPEDKSKSPKMSPCIFSTPETNSRSPKQSPRNSESDVCSTTSSKKYQQTLMDAFLSSTSSSFSGFLKDDEVPIKSKPVAARTPPSTSPIQEKALNLSPLNSSLLSTSNNMSDSSHILNSDVQKKGSMIKHFLDISMGYLEVSLAKKKNELEKSEKQTGGDIIALIMKRDQPKVVLERLNESVVEAARNGPLTSKKKVLCLCGQTEPISFRSAIPETMMRTARKIGEGSYGEVFSMTNKDDVNVAVKIIPIEGDFEVNEGPQKSFQEILSEVILSKHLNDLSYGTKFRTSNFIHLYKVSCVQGKYPRKLLSEWNTFKKNRGTENDNPNVFGTSQLYIIFQFSFGGTDLELYQPQNEQEACSIVAQVACALAVAEGGLEFEHRDLHWGNVLVAPTTEANINYILKGQSISLQTSGIAVSLIDFTLSRMKIDGATVYNDLSKEPSVFKGKGDIQFDVYRKMKSHTKNTWDGFFPYTNVLWLQYINQKVSEKLHNGKAKRNGPLNSWKRALTNYKCATDFATKELNIIF